MRTSEKIAARGIADEWTHPEPLELISFQWRSEKSDGWVTGDLNQ
jgi:hypothetical protein